MTGTSATTVANQGTTVVASSSLPSQVYPSGQVSLYSAPSAAQQADTPAPVRFANIDQIIVAARSGELIAPAIDEITSLLRERHHIKPDGPEDFNIRDMTEIMKTMSSTSELMTKLL